VVRGRNRAAGNGTDRDRAKRHSAIQYVRSISIFGLSDVKLYFDFDSDYFRDRQEVLNRLQTLSLPQNLQPQLSPWSAVGEIYRYQLSDPSRSLNESRRRKIGSCGAN